MHVSSLAKTRLFRKTYLAPFESQPLTVLDVGSAVVVEAHASNRQAMSNPAWQNIGMDIESGINVDVVVKSPYDWAEIGDASVDVVTCSQVFEHTEYFWITILEIARILKPNGLAFIVAPSTGLLHRYPVDCWRFFDDGLPALAKWAMLDNVDARVQWQPVYGKGDFWRDAAIVLQRPLRSLDEERAFAFRSRSAKSALSGMGDNLAGLPDALPPPSIITRVSGQNAMLAHENKLKAAKSGLRYRYERVRTHLRAIRTILFTSAKDTSQA
jgi:SAM-dependent methyltransferase